jgi:two-component system phosphate regulon sensor histidine kinase PhoR
MRLDKPITLALILSLSLGGITFGITSLLRLIYNIAEVPYYITGVLSMAITLISFLLIRMGVENFIYAKIKLIYKNIHELKVGSEFDEHEAAHSNDLDLVTKEVSEWANQNRNEIAELRERENFRREFIGNISHELKTPIFNIQGYLLTLLD